MSAIVKGFGRRPIHLVLRLFAKDPKADVYGGLTAPFRLQDRGQLDEVQTPGDASQSAAADVSRDLNQGMRTDLVVQIIRLVPVLGSARGGFRPFAGPKSSGKVRPHRRH